MLIPKNIFALSDIAAKEEGRYAIDGVRVERDEKGEAIAIATDGKRILSVRWSEESPENYPEGVVESLEKKSGFGATIPVAGWKGAEKLGNKSPKPILQNIALDEVNANGSITFGSTDSDTKKTISPRTKSGIFPKWREVMECQKQGTKVILSVGLLESTARTLKKLGATQVELVVPEQEENNSSPVGIKATTEEGIKIEGILCTVMDLSKK